MAKPLNNYAPGLVMVPPRDNPGGGTNGLSEHSPTIPLPRVSVGPAGQKPFAENATAGKGGQEWRGAGKVKGKAQQCRDSSSNSISNSTSRMQFDGRFGSPQSPVPAHRFAQQLDFNRIRTLYILYIFHFSIYFYTFHSFLYISYIYIIIYIFYMKIMYIYIY